MANMAASRMILTRCASYVLHLLQMQYNTNLFGAILSFHTYELLARKHWRDNLGLQQTNNVMNFVVKYNHFEHHIIFFLTSHRLHEKLFSF